MTISGDNNKVIFKRPVLNLVLNGDNNRIKAYHTKCYLCNVCFNGDDNKVEMNKMSRHCNNFENGGNNVMIIKETNEKLKINGFNHSSSSTVSHSSNY